MVIENYGQREYIQLSVGRFPHSCQQYADYTGLFIDENGNRSVIFTTPNSFVPL